MRENRTCGSEGGAAELNRSFLPLSLVRGSGGRHTECACYFGVR